MEKLFKKNENSIYYLQLNKEKTAATWLVFDFIEEIILNDNLFQAIINKIKTNQGWINICKSFLYKNYLFNDDIKFINNDDNDDKMLSAKEKINNSTTKKSG